MKLKEPSRAKRDYSEEEIKKENKQAAIKALKSLYEFELSRTKLSDSGVVINDKYLDNLKYNLYFVICRLITIDVYHHNDIKGYLSYWIKSKINDDGQGIFDENGLKLDFESELIEKLQSKYS